MSEELIKTMLTYAQKEDVKGNTDNEEAKTDSKKELKVDYNQFSRVFREFKFRFDHEGKVL